MRTNAGKFRPALTALVVMAAIVVMPGGIAVAGPQDYWPMFNRDLLNTGVADPALAGITFPVEMWSYTTDNLIGSGSPVIGDIDNDGQPEVLVSTANFGSTGGIYALNADGTLKWKYQTGDYGTYATPPLADIDGDGKLETIFPSYGGKIIAVDDDGTQMWVVDKGSAGTRSVIVDLTVDDGLEVVAGAASKAFLLKASDGTQIWEADYRMLCDPAIADVDGDGKLEVVFSTSGSVIVALNAEDGTVAWTSAAMGQDAQNNLAIISDINADGKPDVVAGSRDYKMYVFSGADGTKLWDYAVVGRCFSAAVADFNGDGFDDVVTTAGMGTPESYAYLLDVKNQTLLWQHDIVGRSGYTTERSPSIADVNGDGTPDVLIAGLSQKLYALSGVDGSEIWTIDTDDPSAGVPAVGDLDGDGVMEIVVSAGNSVQVFGPPPVLWLDPCGGWVEEGQQVTVDVMMSGGGFNGVEFDLTYDPGLLTFVSVVKGSMWDGHNTNVVQATGNGGTIEFGAFLQQQDTTLDVTQAQVATITFTGLADGESDLTFANTIVSSPDGEELEASTKACTLTVHGHGKVEGDVELQGRFVAGGSLVHHAGASVKITGGPGGGGFEYNGSTDANGHWEITGVIEGDYDVEVEMDRYLDAQRSTSGHVTLSAGGSVDAGFVKLRGGDCDGNARVGSLDASIVATEFGNSHPTPGITDMRADINDDYKVNILDCAILGGNYGKVGPLAW